MEAMSNLQKKSTLLWMCVMITGQVKADCDADHLIPDEIEAGNGISFPYDWGGECCAQELAYDGVCMSSCITSNKTECYNLDNPARGIEFCTDVIQGEYTELTSCQYLGYSTGRKGFENISTVCAFIGPKITTPPAFPEVTTSRDTIPCPADQVIPDYISAAGIDFPNDWGGECCGQAVAFDGVCMSACVVLDGADEVCYQGDNPAVFEPICLNDIKGTFHEFNDCSHYGLAGGIKTFTVDSVTSALVGPFAFGGQDDGGGPPRDNAATRSGEAHLHVLLCGMMILPTFHYLIPIF